MLRFFAQHFLPPREVFKLSLILDSPGLEPCLQVALNYDDARLELTNLLGGGALSDVANLVLNSLSAVLIEAQEGRIKDKIRQAVWEKLKMVL